jgi:hypothetical protein
LKADGETKVADRLKKILSDAQKSVKGAGKLSEDDQKKFDAYVAAAKFDAAKPMGAPLESVTSEVLRERVSQ